MEPSINPEQTKKSDSGSSLKEKRDSVKLEMGASDEKILLQLKDMFTEIRYGAPQSQNLRRYNDVLKKYELKLIYQDDSHSLCKGLTDLKPLTPEEAADSIQKILDRISEKRRDSLLRKTDKEKSNSSKRSLSSNPSKKNSRSDAQISEGPKTPDTINSLKEVDTFFKSRQYQLKRRLPQDILSLYNNALSSYDSKIVFMEDERIYALYVKHVRIKDEEAILKKLDEIIEKEKLKNATQPPPEYPSSPFRKKSALLEENATEIEILEKLRTLFMTNNHAGEKSDNFGFYQRLLKEKHIILKYEESVHSLFDTSESKKLSNEESIIKLTEMIQALRMSKSENLTYAPVTQIGLNENRGAVQIGDGNVQNNDYSKHATKNQHITHNHYQNLGGRRNSDVFEKGVMTPPLEVLGSLRSLFISGKHVGEQSINFKIYRHILRNSLPNKYDIDLHFQEQHDKEVVGVHILSDGASQLPPEESVKKLTDIIARLEPPVTPQPVFFSVSPKVNPKELTKFLHLVAEGEQGKAEAMLKQNRDLALVPGDVTDLSKRTFRGITAFQYALWALDWYMWTMLLNYLLPEQAKAQAQQVDTGSWVIEHGAHANWQSLIDNQKAYLDNFRKWDEEQCIRYWINEVGGEQLLLPAHVLYEYCHPISTFYHIRDFTKLEYPVSGIAKDVHNELRNNDGSPRAAVVRCYPYWRCPKELYVNCPIYRTRYADLFYLMSLDTPRSVIGPDLDRESLALKKLWSVRSQQREALLTGYNCKSGRKVY